MTKPRKRSTGDFRILLPEGKPSRRPPNRLGWAVVLGVLLLVLLWRLFLRRG